MHRVILMMLLAVVSSNAMAMSPVVERAPFTCESIEDIGTREWCVNDRVKKEKVEVAKKKEALEPPWRKADRDVAERLKALDKSKGIGQQAPMTKEEIKQKKLVEAMAVATAFLTEMADMMPYIERVSTLSKAGQCKEAQDFINMEARSGDKITGVLQAIRGVDCNEDENAVEKHLLRAERAGSMIAKTFLEQAAEKKAKGEKSIQIALTDIDDIKIDFDSLQGRKVRVKGVGQYMMDLFMVKKDLMNTSPVIVDISKVDRDQRRQILQKCSNIMAGCNVTIYGSVEKVRGDNGISAERIEW